MYSHFLCSHGGGIDPAYRSVENNGNDVNILIGLGGAGIDCIRTIKTTVNSELIPHHTFDGHPEYNNIRFLGIDCDYESRYSGNMLPLDDEEYLLTANRAYFKEIQNLPDTYSWFNRNIPFARIFPERGAGAIRQIGRFMFFHHAESFVEKIRHAISEGTHGLPENYNIHVSIISGLCGGTGSGCFLDVCYLTRTVLEMMGLHQTPIIGYFFMPEIYSDMSPSVMDAMKANSCAALQELNYCMSLSNNGKGFIQSYGNGIEAKWDSQPVDLCFLIDDQANYSTVFSKTHGWSAYNRAVESTSLYIEQTITNSVYPDHFGLPNFFGSPYFSLGISTVRTPAKEAMNYLASKVFKHISDMRENIPSRQYLDEFIENNALTYGDILDQLTRECDASFQYPDISWQEAKIHNDFIVQDFINQMSSAEKTAETNCLLMIKDLENYDPVFNDTKTAPKSLILKIYAALRNIAVDPEHGPFFAAALISGRSDNDLISTVERYIVRIRGDLNTEIAQKNQLRLTLEKTYYDFYNHTPIFFARSIYPAYRNAIRMYFISSTRTRIMEKMHDMLMRLRARLANLSENFLNIFPKVIDDLTDTFDENIRYFESAADADSACEYPIVQIRDLEKNIDDAVEAMNMDAQVSNLLNTMLSEQGIKSWRECDEDKLFTIINDFFTYRFSEYSHKTMTDYIQDKFRKADPTQLAVCIKDGIMEQLYNDAAPLFSQSPTHTASKFGYIIFPSIAEETANAANQFSISKEPGELTLIDSNIKDRISLIRFYGGLTIRSYSRIKEYETVLSKIDHYSPGLHIYEGKERDRMQLSPIE